MQAIVTKYLGPTNHRGSRVKAKCLAGSIIVPWQSDLDVQRNHDKAATMLAKKLGWDRQEIYGRMCSGGLPDQTGNCYVFCKG